MNADKELFLNPCLSVFIRGHLQLAACSNQVDSFIGSLFGARKHQQTTELLANAREEFHFDAGVRMRIAMLYVDDAFHAPARKDGCREESVVGVFRQVAEELEAGISKGLP